MEFSLFTRSSEYQSLAAGTRIFSVGDPGDFMYGVKEGQVEIHQGDTVIDVLGPGDVFGEMALIDKQPRSASARALTDCQVVPVDEKRFNFMVQQTPFFGLQLMRLIVFRLRRATGA